MAITSAPVDTDDDEAPEPPLLLKLSTPHDIVEAVPHLIGFHPAESLVVLSMRGPRRRLGLKVRIDLPPARPRAEKSAASLVAAHLAHAGGDTAFVVVYTEQPSDAEGLAEGLARARLVETVRSALERKGLALMDALLVQGGRWQSYHCTDPACCPPDGELVSTGETSSSRVAATATFAGLTALPSREHLERSLRAPRSVARAAADQALSRVLVDLLRRRAGGATHAQLRDEARALLLRQLQSYDDGPGQLEPDDAARLVVALVDVSLRDEVISMSTGPHHDSLRRLLTDLARRAAVPPDDAPAVTTLAAVAYAQGDGTVARIALDRALASDPNYSLAKLLREGLDRGVDPKHLRKVWKAAAAGKAG